MQEFLLHVEVSKKKKKREKQNITETSLHHLIVY